MQFSFQLIFENLSPKTSLILNPVLARSRKIYMPVLNDTLSVCKVTQFENLLRIWNKEKILEKTEKVHLPFHMDRISSDAYVEQLVWSELGDYIRELLRKERS